MIAHAHVWALYVIEWGVVAVGFLGMLALTLYTFSVVSLMIYKQARGLAFFLAFLMIVHGARRCACGATAWQRVYRIALRYYPKEIKRRARKGGCIPPAALRVERDQGVEVALNSDEWRAFYATIDKRCTVRGRGRNTQ